jgi:hypothetical protein
MFQPARGRPRSVELADGVREGRRLAKAGMRRAAENAGDEFRAGMAQVVEDIARRRRFFTMDEVRALAAERGLEPHHYNAFGHVLPTAAKRGIVRRRADLQRVPSERPEAHGNPNLQWESLILGRPAGLDRLKAR